LAKAKAKAMAAKASALAVQPLVLTARVLLLRSETNGPARLLLRYAHAWHAHTHTQHTQ
jgi:hypothetical protein